ncbi:2-succinyl-6-hydroxy-2,4-cyclohexadiene-1-carboxylate synthase [Siminovitchia acidinfaciens]|uniref:Putative 2-succinyl-6-hydroxy-2,4-cyclohexadiene-1-carboxylate synthase n=1 Tax=Siminovitchia acidinfaciens TaxID=2321395 RepID=A0A429Y551_9BACI|nr:2-succinyl-6-hydroxy-2,4-cyclohexadiene-1-carboxylate synthase [Siminovitchia acidinfaciens]RST76531.1 2-succinyl-6-hydroxy-2,4-cyclohexadiene-1-carboxylate synthase [Siminovitchia acidinfaciens]
MLITVDGVLHNVEIYGKRSAPSVILLHGFTGDHTTWKGLGQTLEDSFHVIAIDLLGHGKTVTPEFPERYEMKRAAKDIIHIMDQLQINSAHLLGYSMGGRLALGVAMIFPERIKSLLLESSSPGLKTEKEKEVRIKSDESLAAKILDKGIERFVNYWGNIPLFQTQKNLPVDVQNQIRAQRLKNDPIGLANSLKGFGTGRQPSWWQRLNELKLPVLLICGELDEKFCKIAQEMNQLLPESTLMEIKKAGHAIHVEEPEIFDTIVKEFLMKQEQLS